MFPTDTQPARAGSSRSVGATSLACSEWNAFRGPGRRWERSVERMELEAEGRIVEAIASATAGDSLTAVHPAWVAFLRLNMPVAAFAFHACGLVLQVAGEQCRPPSVAGGIRLQASMQLRQAQAIVLYSADIEQRLGAMPMEGARSRWKDDAAWSPARAFLTRVSHMDDWAERVVAVNLCFELVGQLLRREFAIRLGARHGDPVTPVVAEAGQAEWALSRDWTLAWVAFLLADEAHGARNAALLRGWVAASRPGALTAVGALATLGEDLPFPSPPGWAAGHVTDDHVALLTSAGLEG
jgi:hypothetical protein